MICCKCKEDKSIEDFAFRFKGKGIRQKQCRKCHNESRRNRYANNPTSIKQKVAKRNKELREANWKARIQYLVTHPCVDCGSIDYRILQFDHVRGKKKYNISSLMGYMKWDSKIFQEEIEKCDVRCANCHSIKTWNQFKYGLNTMVAVVWVQSDPSQNKAAFGFSDSKI